MTARTRIQITFHRSVELNRVQRFFGVLSINDPSIILFYLFTFQFYLDRVIPNLVLNWK